MSFSLSGRALAALVAGGLFFGSCGGNGASTNTPSSTLGTDSAATKVGGMPDSTGAMGAPAGGTNGATMNSTDPNTSATGTSATGSTMSNSPAGTAGTPTMGGTGASGTTNSTGAN